MTVETGVLLYMNLKLTSFQKNAMDSVLADIDFADPTADSDVEMPDLTPRAVQKQEKKKRDKKKEKGPGEEKKKKKRKHEEANGEVEFKKKKKKTKA